MWRLRKQSVSPSPLRKTCCTSSCCQSLFSFSLEKGACVSVCVCMCLCVCVCWAFHGAFCKCVGGAVTWLWHSVAHSSGKKKNNNTELSAGALLFFESICLYYTGVIPPRLPPPSVFHAVTIWTAASGTPCPWAAAPCQDTVTRWPPTRWEGSHVRGKLVKRIIAKKQKLSAALGEEKERRTSCSQGKLIWLLSWVISLHGENMEFNHLCDSSSETMDTIFLVATRGTAAINPTRPKKHFFPIDCNTKINAC